MWRLAGDAGSLDVNSSYSYVLWCRDFAETSVVARVDDDRLGGFVTGYVRPDRPESLFVWQVAVDPGFRGRGLARRMLDALRGRMPALGCRYLEATVTPDNLASTRLFESFAAGADAPLRRESLFGPELFPGEHASEVLFQIGPVD